MPACTFDSLQALVGPILQCRDPREHQSPYPLHSAPAPAHTWYSTTSAPSAAASMLDSTAGRSLYSTSTRRAPARACASVSATTTPMS